MTSNFLYGVCYSPTWAGWTGGYQNNGPDAQFSDSDFFNVAFQALWDSGSDGGNNYRNDLGTMSNVNFGLVRLYDWGPVRGWTGTMGTAHQDFLATAVNYGLKIIVPISNYFLSDDEYAWNEQNPDSSYSFASAPTDIQQALQNFLTSVTDPTTNQIYSSVHSFAVGNEVDINTLAGQGTSGPVDPAARLGRILWWIVNLQAKLSAGLGQALLTSPISNADQGGSITDPPSYWFQVFVNGVESGVTPLPVGTQGGSGTFDETWPGLATFSWYANWYYNSVNLYQYTIALTATIGQYDQWTASTTNSDNWPGQQFKVPLLFTEIGYARTTQSAQFTGVIDGICQPVQTYLAAHPDTLLAGYCLFEWNDEPGVSTTLWGIQTLGPVEFEAQTGATVVSYGTFPNVAYPVTQLEPVMSSSNQPLTEALHAIFTGTSEARK
jgi:hypothetical protein